MKHEDRREGNAVSEKAVLFDSSIVGTAQQAVDFITNILESSTEYSVIAKDLTGKILLWNEGARRLYGDVMSVLRLLQDAIRPHRSVMGNLGEYERRRRDDQVLRLAR